MLFGALHEKAREMATVMPRSDAPQNSDNERKGKAHRIHEEVVGENIDNDRPEERKTEDAIAVEEEERASDNLHAGNQIKVVRRKEGADKLARCSGRQAGIRKELEKTIQAEEHKDKTKKDPSNERDDFHEKLRAGHGTRPVPDA